MNLSQRKGKEYERYIAHKLQTVFGEEVRRTGAQEKWKSRSGDVNPRNSQSLLGKIHWEAKNRETWQILEWYKEAKDDAELYKMPVVVCTKNREEDFAFLSLDDFLKILYELDGYRKNTVLRSDPHANSN